MSTSTQKPLTESVCVKYEDQIVGYRDLTDLEWSEEIESFSSGIPSVIGGTLEDLRETGAVFGHTQALTRVIRVPDNDWLENVASPIPAPTSYLGFILGMVVLVGILALKSE